MLGGIAGEIAIDAASGYAAVKALDIASDMGRGTRFLGKAVDKLDEVRGLSKVTDEIAFKTGQQGEKHLVDLVGGESQVYFKTSYGGRYVDQLADGIAYESKVGYRSLDSFTKK